MKFTPGYDFFRRKAAAMILDHPEYLAKGWKWKWDDQFPGRMIFTNGKQTIKV